MRTFTFKWRTVLCSLFVMMSFAPSWAQTGPADFFGKWTFKADLNVTEAGNGYADLFKNDCEVVFSAHSIYDMEISGFAGAVVSQMVNNMDFENNLIKIYNPNGNDPNKSLWGTVAIANANGDYPYGGSFSMDWTWGADGKTISVPDFTAVLCDHMGMSAEVLATFTNCTLTLKEHQTIEVADMSGDWHFKAFGQTTEGSPFPTEFDMVLAAANAEFTAYTATMSFEGYGDVTFNDVKFDGNRMTMAFDNTFIGESNVAFGNMNGTELTGEIVFIASSEKTLTLNSGMVFREKVDDGGTVTYPGLQYYIDGTALKQVESLDFAGIYNFKSENLWPILADDEYKVEYPAEFSLKVEFVESTGKYYVTEFMGSQDVYNLNYGGLPCEVEGNVLKITVSREDKAYMVRSIDTSADFLTMVYDIILDGMGEKKLTVDLTLNEDGTATLGDFFLNRMTRVYAADYNSFTDTEEQAVYYGTITGSREAADKFEPAGTYTIKAGKVEKLLTSDDYAVEYPGEVTFTVAFSEAAGKYFVTEFMGSQDVYNLNYGGLPCEVEGNVLKITVSREDKAYMVRSLYTSDDFTTMVYDIILDGHGEKVETVDLTYTGNDTYTLGDFYLARLTRVYATDWSSFTEEEVLAAHYSNLTNDVQTVVQEKESGVYVKGGVIYVKGGEAVPVEVYTTSGAKVFGGVVSEVRGLNKGLYIVKCGTSAVKVAL